MNSKRIFAAAMLMLALTVFLPTRAAALQLETQLIWATSETKSPEPRHRPVEPEIRRRLESLPLKWTNFFEVNRRRFEVIPGATCRVELSNQCAVEVKTVAGDRLEVTLIGRGKPTWRGLKALPRGEVLVIAGNAPAASAWFVTLKRVE